MATAGGNGRVLPAALAQAGYREFGLGALADAPRLIGGEGVDVAANHPPKSGGVSTPYRATSTTLMPRDARPWANAVPTPSAPPATMPQGP
jgi:hypothetical protein